MLDDIRAERCRKLLPRRSDLGRAFARGLERHTDDAAESPVLATTPPWVRADLDIRKLRDDETQYQDNFLPQAVAKLVKREGSHCDHWKRSEAGSSHYFRPLKYHGDGVVRQHGPNMMEETVPHTKGYYKMR